jgi:hypothetical protein
MKEEGGTETAAREKRMGVVIVHGMGHPDPAVLLKAIVESIVRFMESLTEAHGKFEKPVWRWGADEDGRTTVTVSFCGRQWIFTEAHWAPHITSPPFLDTMRWAVRHFLAHASVLLRDAVLRSLLPTVTALRQIAVHTLWALLLLPARLLMLGLAPLLAGGIVTLLEKHFRRAIGTLPNEADIHALMGRLQLWHRFAPTAVAGLLNFFVIAPVLVLGVLGLLFNWIAPAAWWLVPAGLYLAATSTMLFYQFVDRLACDPVLYGHGPLPIVVAGGLIPSKHGFLQARIVRPGAKLVFCDGVRQILAGPAEAALSGARHWLTANREYQLLDYLDWALAGSRPLPLIKAGALVTTLAVFRLLASFLWASLYLLGVLLIIPVTALILALSAFGGFSLIGALVSPLKRGLEGLVLTSIGDINMFTRHPEQAAVARAQVEHALDALNARCDEVCVIAHSLGCAVSYDTLVQPDNAERTAQVRTLMTIGGILPMVWRTTPRRAAFDAALPGEIRWVNIWARFDPAEGGPINKERATVAMPSFQNCEPAPRRTFLWLLPRDVPQSRTFEDVAVSNEDDILRDHTTYWQNYHEVIPRIAFEIWPDGAETLDSRVRSDAIRAFRRRVRVLERTGPRVLVWCAGPFLLAAGVGLLPTVALTAVLAIAVWVSQLRREQAEPSPASTTDLPAYWDATGTLADGTGGRVVAVAPSKKAFRGFWRCGSV